MIKLLYLSFATATISFAETEPKIFKFFREWAGSRNSLLGELFSCGYCFGHWVALALVLTYKHKLFELWWPLDYVLTALAVAWFSAFQWALMCWLMDKAGK